MVGFGPRRPSLVERKALTLMDVADAPLDGRRLLGALAHELRSAQPA